MRSFHCGFRIAAALGLASSTPLAQQGGLEIPFQRVRSELVLVDLIASDQQGNPVRDLRQDEVQLLEDGKKQEIGFFELLRVDPAGEEGPYPVASPAQQSSLVIFLDSLGLEADVFRRVKDSLRTFLNGPEAAGMRFMLTSYRNGLFVHQGFTDDPTKLAETLESLEAAPEAQAATASFAQFAQTLETILRDSAGDSLTMAAAQGKSFASGLERQAAAVAGSLTVLVRSLRSIPGRKQLLLISSGYPQQPLSIVRQMIDKRVRGAGAGILSSAHKERMNAILSGGSGVDLRPQMEELIDQANRSQVSVYGIDARGLDAAGLADQARYQGTAALLGSAYLAEIRDAINRAPQWFLDDLAQQTGGQSFFNSNDLTTGLAMARRDASSYYLLAYRPSGKRKVGKFHTIEVKVQRPGVSARYRQGYLETEPQSDAAQDVMAAISSPELFSDYTFQVQVERKESGKLALTTVVPTQAVRFYNDGEKFHASVGIYAALLDSQGKWVGKDFYFTRGHQFKAISAEQRDKILSYATFSLTAEADLPPPGDYQLVVVIRQGADGTLCARRQPLLREGG